MKDKGYEIDLDYLITRVRKESEGKEDKQQVNRLEGFCHIF